jgi:hypothetical protein
MPASGSIPRAACLSPSSSVITSRGSTEPEQSPPPRNEALDHRQVDPRERDAVGVGGGVDVMAPGVGGVELRGLRHRGGHP